VNWKETTDFTDFHGDYFLGGLPEDTMKNIQNYAGVESACGGW
jgi:hypothetical protein